MGGKSTTTVSTPPPPTQQELDLQGLSVEEKRMQIDALKEQSGLQKQYYDMVLPQLQRQAAEQAEYDKIISPTDRATMARDDFERQKRLGPIQDELLGLQLAQIKQGGRATPEQLADIRSASNAAIASGSGDIRDAQQEGLSLLREELAPSLGLRSTDTPILDRGNTLGREALKQIGGLERNLRGVEANAVLNYPLAVQQMQGAQVQGQQQLTAGIDQFRQQLQQQAFQNRLALSGQVSQGGLGLASIGQGANGFRSTGATSQTTKSSGFGLGEVGQVASGIGALAAFSDRNMKDTIAPADAEAIADAIERMPIDRWHYKDDSSEHIGPYAQDFKSAFKLGDGKTIQYVDGIGVLFAAVKALAGRVRELEGARLNEQG